MKKDGFYDLLLTQKQLQQEGCKTNNIKNETIDDIDSYLIGQFINSFLVNVLTEKSTIAEKISFLNQLISLETTDEILTDEILLQVNKSNLNYQNKLRLTENYLFTNRNEQKLIYELNHEIITADAVDFIFPFISKSVLNKIEASIKCANENNIKIRIITTTFDNMALYVNLFELTRLVNTYQNLQVRIEDNLQKRSERIHIKGSIFKRKSGFGTAIIGSSNMTYTGMSLGREWNVKLTEFNNANLYKDLVYEFEMMWQDNLVNFNNKQERENLIQKINEAQVKQIENVWPVDTQFTTVKKYLYDYQEKIVNKLAIRRKMGKNKHLIIMATGTGKTVVAAFDYKNIIKEHNDIKVSLLFLAHQKEILDQAHLTFKTVLEDKAFGSVLYDGKSCEQKIHVFATVQSMVNRLEHFKTDDFNVIIFDESHHIVASSFEKVFNYFKPKQLLGLTATPERSDGKIITNFFDNEYAYELRMWDAINTKLLCPFDYYCIDDSDSNLIGIDLDNDKQIFQALNTKQRNELLYEVIAKYIGVHAKPKCVVFCITIDHAKVVADFLRSRSFSAIYLTSEIDSLKREKIINDFKIGKIDYLCVINMFNEGIDIPQINTIIMLRPTNSKTLYLQQIGRGLRKIDGKNKLEIYDFIANVDSKFDITVGIKNLYNNNLNSVKAIENNEGLPYNCTITFERRSQQIILQNLKKWFTHRHRIKSQVQEYYRKYQSQGLYKLLFDFDLNLAQFYNYLNDFYLKIGQNISKYAHDENNFNRNINILKQFLFLNCYEIVDYFYNRLSQKIKATAFNFELDNLLMCSVLYEVSSRKVYHKLFENMLKQQDAVEYFIKNNRLIVDELLLILKYKLDNEDLLINSDKPFSLRFYKSTYTVRQALCVVNRLDFINQDYLKIIAFQAGYLVFGQTNCIILADIEVVKYGKLTNYDAKTCQFLWSLPSTKNEKSKLVNDLKDKTIVKSLFLQNLINKKYENLYLKLYDYIGIGEFTSMVDHDILTAQFKV